MHSFVRYFFLFLCISPLNPCEASQIGPALAARLRENPAENTRLTVTVAFREQPPVQEMLSQYEQQGKPLSERAREVNRVCRSLSDRIQLPFLAQIREGSRSSATPAPRLVRRFWIVNMLEMDITTAHIRQLVEHPAVAEVELSNAIRISGVKPAAESASTEMPNGREVGLTAIGAPGLWNLGYTGKGRKAMLMDTGVWPDHPALRGKFLGTRYPLSQVWLPYDYSTPRDKSSNHGTHVIGTVLGLDTATRDTIGAAFDAYFIATDPIVTNIALVRDWTQLMAAFEWALDPDGDTSTTHDLPDVINNSWGRSNTGFDSLCGHPLITTAMLAVEAAGIANVFSTGNDGPGLTTTIVPAQVIIDSLNLFSVGAIQAAAPGYPLAGFSSWGPSRCTTDSLLSIKPEVSAPGLDVRSADGPTGYGLKSGTSMASPHVSGAVLLLKEAFPQLSGRQILHALYRSATDLGAPGEDNQYGRGLIHVPSAFQFLSQSHTPLPPARDYDLAIAGIDSPETAFFGSGGCWQPGPIVPPTPVLRQRWRVVVMNRGDSVMPGFRLYIELNGQRDSLTYTSPLNAGERVGLTTPYYNLFPPGQPSGGPGASNRLLLRALNLAGIPERDTINNRWFAEFPTRNVVETRLYEAFDSVRTPALYGHRIDDWVIRDPDADGKTWQLVATGGRASQAACVKMKDYGPANGQRDELISPLLWLSRPAGGAGGTGQLSFDLAYSNRSTTFSDTLFVDWSVDCGDSYQRLWVNGGDSMKTYNGLVPSDTIHWRRWQISLPDSLLQAFPLSARLRFTTQNDWGGNLYLSNIQVFYQVAGVGELDSTTAVRVYPNPAQDVLYVRLPGAGWEEPLLFDIPGRLQKVECAAVDATTYSLNTRELAPGVYVVRTQSHSRSAFEKVVVAR